MKIRNAIPLALTLILSFSTAAFADEIDDRVTSINDRIDRLVSRGCASPSQGERFTSKLNNIKSYIDMRRSRGLPARGANRQLDELIDRIDRTANSPNNPCSNK
jgi:hypothetical protein